jgi:radical SAM enzyme (TIGR01210 family)
MNARYPQRLRARDRWILAQRANTARAALDPQRPHAFCVEEERAASGEIVPVATIFLTNRECPWRCLMCDLWRNTLPYATPPSAIPAQIDYALSRLPAARQIKLYNSGSFFDSKAVPLVDHGAIARRARNFERVIVECHPALISERCLRFRDLLHDAQLEIAMGLETAHPRVLAQLNKRMTLEQFARAAAFLRANNLALRVFILLKPPFLDEEEALHWAKRSLDFAFDCDATVAALIPTRLGNGALEALAEQGKFSPPKLVTLEAMMSYGLAQKRGRVFADLWDLERLHTCPHCFAARAARLHEMNLKQTQPAQIVCPECGDKT